MQVFTAKDGRKIPVDVASAAMIVEGRGSGAVVVFQDITERLRKESLKDDFVAFASHELRNPLTSVKGFSRWLAGRVQAAPAAFDEEVQSAISTLVEESDRMESIVDLFLDLARLDSNRMSFEKEPVDLRRLMEDECDRLRLRYPAARCDALVPDLTLFAVSDDHRLRQVVGNLLDNAAKYAGDVAQVTVSLEAKDGLATLRIRDNGPGIPAQDQPHIFDRYYRGRDAMASRRKGLGVGLFITKQLVDLLGGTLTFTSSRDGTEFVLRVPLLTIEYDDVP